MAGGSLGTPLLACFIKVGTSSGLFLLASECRESGSFYTGRGKQAGKSPLKFSPSKVGTGSSVLRPAQVGAAAQESRKTKTKLEGKDDRQAWAKVLIGAVGFQ